ncbi:Transcriptional regulatory protein fixJ [Oligella urethralis]|uniref:Transcriptional regulatory protein fixJ n=2 Tax=Alcaligenaceae TaxID=506 RepID=A0A2X1UXX1_9BURK|nr:DNA-binding response regulator [Oligella urethralis]OFV47891.1 DNA-binding response regulator [Oligella sp. HMSC09E12]SPY08573.1 Transcriptional regulatory protein fixJ [Oligella urethralis]
MIDHSNSVIFIVDDDDAVRDSLRLLLETQNYRVQTFASGEEFLEQYNPNLVSVLITDVRMPGMSGLQLQEQLLERKATLPIIFITGHGDVNMAVSTMKKGAVDFIEKPFNLEDIKPVIARFLDQAYEQMQEAISQQAVDSLLARLTSREEQVLERIVAGRLNKQIADDLSISIKTVEAHRANIMEKLEVSTVADLMKIVLKK